MKSHTPSVTDFFDPYDENAHMERYFRRTFKENGKKSRDIMSKLLLRSFEEYLIDLKTISIDMNSQINLILDSFRDFDLHFSNRISEASSLLEESNTRFDRLNDHISLISNKVNMIGTEMQHLSGPEKRCKEALGIIKNLREFMDSSSIPERYFDKKQIFENCKLICALMEVVSELKNPRFSRVQTVVRETFNLLEKMLLEMFEQGQKQADLEKMKKCAQSVSHSPIYQRCYEQMISICINDGIDDEKLFDSIVETMELCYKFSVRVFESIYLLIMSDMANDIYGNIISNYLVKKLPNGISDADSCEMLHKIYKSVLNMEDVISGKDIGLDKGKLSIHNSQVFDSYLKIYFSRESTIFQERLEYLLKKFNDQILAHAEKKGREYKLSTAVVSTDLAMNMISQSRSVIERCKLLSSLQDIEGNAEKIFCTLLKYLGDEHCLSAINQAIKNLPSVNPKQQPSFDFFGFLEQITLIIHFLEKHLTLDVMTIVGSGIAFQNCIKSFSTFVNLIESKVEECLDKLLCSIVNWTKSTMRAEYLNSDFQGSSDCLVQSKACKTICSYYQSLLNNMTISLDKNTADAFALELSVNMIQILFEHIRNFVFTCEGALNVMHDIKLYESLFSGLKKKETELLFHTAQRLIDLLLMNPMNVADIWFCEDLKDVEIDLKKQILQLRVDFNQINMKALF